MDPIKEYHTQRFRNKMFHPELQYPIKRKKLAHPDKKIITSVEETKETVTNTCQENFHQYLMYSTLHGLRYVGDRTLTFFERFFFGVMFVLVFLCAVYFISNVWGKWSTYPMMITLSAISRPITEFPFPSVTICNMNQARKSAMNEMFPDMTSYGSVEYALVQSLCGVNDDNATNVESGKWADFQRLLTKVSQPCEDMLVWCGFGGFERNCMEIFTSTLTDEGLCCIFNGLSKKYTMRDQYSNQKKLNDSDLRYDENFWSPEQGYSSDPTKFNRNASPRPGIGTGNQMGLSLVLNVEEREYFCSSTNSYGFKILLHSPNETPNIAYFGTSIANGYESRVVVLPTISEASNSVRRVPVKTRQCLFENENSLSFFRTYSQKNCQTECETNIYLKYCNCVIYYMPLFHDDINICGRPDDSCVNDVTRELRAKVNSSFLCDCLPGCFAFSFETELSLTPLLSRSPMLVKKSMTARNTAIVHIYYKEKSFRSQRKEEMVGFTEFLSNTGGLLGLFMGFSVISICELFYFMTIRPYCSYRRISRKRTTFQAVINRIRGLKFRNRLNVTQVVPVARNNDNIVFPYVD